MRVSMKYLLAAALVAAGTSGAAQIRIVEPTVSGDMMQFPPGGRQVKTGTGVVRGRVLALETGGPIRRAQVRLSGPEILPKVSLTDAEGRFEFRELPAGRFTMQATKSGFVSVQFGQTRPFESGRPIELADRQVLDNSDIYMPRGSVIAGRIVDEFGDPVPDVMVTALRQTWSNGRRRLAPAPGRMAQTNDLGQYRIYGLPPGDYYVSASMRNTTVETMVTEMAAVRAFAAAPSSGTSTPSSGYAPTYYPGTPNGGEAQKITLIAGQENAGADFALVPVRLAKITGIVLSSDGKPASGAMVNVTPRAGVNDLASAFAHTTARTNQDGAFTLNGVAPGDYLLQANAMQVIAQERTEGGNTMVFTMRSGPGGSGGDESGSLPIVVAGEDLTNIVLTTAKGARVTGKVTFEDGARPQSIGNIRISTTAADADGPAVSFGGGMGTVNADGAFELSGLTGLRLVRVMGLPPGWMLKSVRYNGADITDTGAEFRPGEAVSGLEVVLTNRTTIVSGGVTASNGTPIKDYTVVIFADNDELWRVPMTRWVTGARPDQEGRFKVQSLPPGTYHAVAVEYLPSGEWGDPELLERLRGKGEQFTLDEGGTPVLDLKLVGAY